MTEQRVIKRSLSDLPDPASRQKTSEKITQLAQQTQTFDEAIQATFSLDSDLQNLTDKSGYKPFPDFPAQPNFLKILEEIKIQIQEMHKEVISLKALIENPSK